MQQLILPTHQLKKSEKYFLQNFQLMFLSDLSFGNRALSPLIDKYHQIINLGIVDLLSIFDFLQ